ncbi:hypothetical protein TNCV_830401 [Trichonephila clavipes]|nr:hypothetical protein TNCV_830401 [Trichonephila clavipes]
MRFNKEGSRGVCKCVRHSTNMDGPGRPGSGASHLSSINLTKGLATQRLFRVHPCREGTIHLQISMPSPGFELKPYSTAVSVTNHYIGRVALLVSSSQYCN